MHRGLFYKPDFALINRIPGLDDTCVDKIAQNILEQCNLADQPCLNSFDRRGIDLPAELWVMIFEHIVHPQHVSESHRFLLDLTLVCQSWAHLILHTPSFWVDIRIEEGMEDLEATVEMLLILSRDCLLSLYHVFGSQCVHQVAHLLRPHLHRVDSLTLLPPTGLATTDALIPHLIFTQLRALQFPRIATQIMAKFLSNHFPFSHWAAMIDDPNLPTRINNPDLPTSLISDGEQLTEIDLPVVTESTLRQLGRMNSLRRVSIGEGPMSPIHWKLHGEDVTLGWTSLHSFDIPWSVTSRFVRGCTETLVSLLVSIDCTITPALISTLSAISNLLSLAVELRWNCDTKQILNEYPSLPTAQLNLRELDI